MLFGVIAVALHVAARRRIELGPGHQGLTWIAMLILGRLTSRQRWAGVATATGAAAATMLPFWRLGDPLLWVTYALAGVIVDLGFTGPLRGRRTLWALVLLGGIAHASKPLVRALLVQFGGLHYESLLAGLPIPLASHFMFGAAGAAIGVALARIGRAPLTRANDPAS